jgi:hypothetical protein
VGKKAPLAPGLFSGGWRRKRGRIRGKNRKFKKHVAGEAEGTGQKENKGKKIENSKKHVGLPTLFD